MTEQRPACVGTRWGRASAWLAAGFVPVVAIAAAAQQGAVAMAINAQSERATFSTNGITTDSPIGIILDPQPTKRADGSVFQEYVVGLAAIDATAHGLCVAEKTSVFGHTVTLLLTSDDDSIQVGGVVGGLHTVRTQLEALGELKLNVSASEVEVPGQTLDGLLGEVGISGEGARLGSAYGTLKAANISSADIASFNAQLIPGDADCPRP